MSKGFSYGPNVPERKNTCGKILLSSVMRAASTVGLPRSPRVTGVCEMAGGDVSSSPRAATLQSRRIAAAE